MGSIHTRPGLAGKSAYQAEIRLRGQRPVRKTFTRLTDARAWMARL